ncbi:cupin domain-containing protein [Algibacter pacificus]|uniref:cupin domain-containing protein n=1 Tax=Algibacter pacificus TaxID=2599389 RepID=UPI0011CBD0B4|nr:cupin domain-containing protein [Algibacter pacificus]
MKIASLTEGITYNEEKPQITLLLKTETTKEIRIAFKKGQLMKAHKAPFPIVVEIFEGEIEFGVNGVKNILKKGALIALDADVPHDLKGLEDAIVRLSISIADKVKRVENVTNL